MDSDEYLLALLYFLLATSLHLTYDDRNCGFSALEKLAYLPNLGQLTR